MCVCVGEVGVGLVMIPMHVSLFVIHTMTSSAITTRLSGELWGRDKTYTHTQKHDVDMPRDINRDKPGHKQKDISQLGHTHIVRWSHQWPRCDPGLT